MAGLRAEPGGRRDMVAAVIRSDTVFTVLGDVARRRSERSLALQIGFSLGAAVVTAMAWHFWAASAIALAVGAHGAWGLLARQEERHPASVRRGILVMVSALGTISAVAGLVGFALG